MRNVCIYVSMTLFLASYAGGDNSMRGLPLGSLSVGFVFTPHAVKTKPQKRAELLKALGIQSYNKRDGYRAQRAHLERMGKLAKIKFR